jgi:hypothetical protein
MWLYASGAPNMLAGLVRDEPGFLRDYHRMDFSLQYGAQVGGARLEAAASLYNVYDRRNSWYRTPVTVMDEAGAGRRLYTANVDVYDLGFQPSFDISVTF